MYIRTKMVFYICRFNKLHAFLIKNNIDITFLSEARLKPSNKLWINNIVIYCSNNFSRLGSPVNGGRANISQHIVQMILNFSIHRNINWLRIIRIFSIYKRL